MIKKKNILYRVAGVIAFLVIINLLSNTFFFRLDFTSDQRFTLSQVTRKILKEVGEPIIITFYISEDLPPDVSRLVKDFQRLLVEYDHFSRRNIEFEHINPNKNEELEMQALEAGIRPVPLEVREKDQLKVQKVFLGVVIQVGEKSEVIPLIKPGIAMEYTLTSLIKKLTLVRKPEVGYVQGHGEPPLAALSQANQELSILYQLKSINLSEEEKLDEFKSLVIVAPLDSFPNRDLQRLDEYLGKGGNIFIALDRVRGFLQRGVGLGVNTGLEKWLEDKGLLVEEAFVVDKKCSTVTVNSQQGFFSYNQQISFPYLPVITNFSDHSITDGLESVVLQFASPITYVGDSAVKFQPLAWTSTISGKFPAPVSFEIGRPWRNRDFLYPEQPVAALIEGHIAGENSAKICLVGDGNFMVNGTGPTAIQIQPDNIHFMVNAVDWLSDDSGLLALRTKGISSRPLDEMEDSSIVLTKYFNFLFPLVLIILYGVYRFERQRIKRARRMRPGYVK